MTNLRTHPVKELEDLLDRERGALIEGDFDEIERLLVRKSELIHAIGTDENVEAAELEIARKKISANRTLFDEALTGIRSVSARLEALRALRGGPVTYDVRGQSSRLDRIAPGRLEKRS